MSNNSSPPKSPTESPPTQQSVETPPIHLIELNQVLIQRASSGTDFNFNVGNYMSSRANRASTYWNLVLGYIIVKIAIPILKDIREQVQNWIAVNKRLGPVQDFDNWEEVRL